MIVAFDWFTVPTVTFKLLYCFFVIEHGRHLGPPGALKNRADFSRGERAAYKFLKTMKSSVVAV
jgi:hypothetical protein